MSPHRLVCSRFNVCVRAGNNQGRRADPHHLQPPGGMSCAFTCSKVHIFLLDDETSPPPTSRSLPCVFSCAELSLSFR
eukprot:679631-Rhodomonas_salina.4